ncbi:MAG: ketoacyl-ACP synthase III [Nitrospinae bacterium]|nr:ketoacyl-ACP synthase III [Nitrospinota bacterium]
MNIQIAGTGRHLPEDVLTNADLEKMVATSNQWIVERTGIHERRIAGKGVCASDLAAPAAQQALAAAGIKPEEVDLIIVGTSTPDMYFPSTACFVQAKIGAVNAVAFDVLAACSGFIYGLSMAENFLKGGKFKTALVIGAEVYSSIINWEDRTTCVLFGDGAGAVVLRAGEGTPGILSTHIFSDGTKAGDLYTPGGGSVNRFTPELVTMKKYALTMKGNSTFKVAVKSMADAARIALEKNGVSASDLKMVVPHQANQRIISAVAKQLGLDESLFYSNLERYGNTAAASIPIALDEVVREGKAVKGDLILMVTFGGGFTWGSALIRL